MSNSLEYYEKVLLINPAFPIKRNNSKHKFIYPIGLLKIGSYYQSIGAEVKLIWLNDDDWLDRLGEFKPQIIYITSIFTYYAEYVKQAVDICKEYFPTVKIIVGGVFASILPEKCKSYTQCDEIIQGIIPETENVPLDYELLGNHKHDFDYQIIHTTRGCIRNCKYCSGHIIEDKFTFKKSIIDEIKYKHILFYDNNLLANPYIEKILEELIELKQSKIISSCEARVGLDYRIINRNPKLARLLKKAGFKQLKIAWDSPLSNHDPIKKCIDYLIDAGFRAVDIGVYMLSNYELSYEELEKKRIKCYKWGVIIINCRYIPLTTLTDNYNPYLKKQTSEDYYIHKGWTDNKIRTFARNVRKTNQCVRYNRKYYSKAFERKLVPKDKFQQFKKMSFDEAKRYFKDAWNPDKIYLIKEDTQSCLEDYD